MKESLLVTRNRLTHLFVFVTLQIFISKWNAIKMLHNKNCCCRWVVQLEKEIKLWRIVIKVNKCVFINKFASWQKLIYFLILLFLKPFNYRRTLANTLPTWQLDFFIILVITNGFHQNFASLFSHFKHFKQLLFSISSIANETNPEKLWTNFTSRVSFKTFWKRKKSWKKSTTVSNTFINTYIWYAVL